MLSQRMEHPVIQCEDQNHDDSSETGEIHGPSTNSGEKNKAGRQDFDFIKVITVGKKDTGSKLEKPPIVIPVDEQRENGPESKTLSNASKINVINGTSRDFYVTSPLLSMDSCVTIPKNSEIKFKEVLSPHLGLDPKDLTSEDVGLDDKDDYLVGKVGVYDFPRTSGASSSQGDVPENLAESNKVQEVEEPKESSRFLTDENHFEQECPICTELYDASSHKQSLLNCNHVFCDNCIKTMVNKANPPNLGRVTCPLCRQTSPRMEWEIRKMQEQMLDNGGIHIQQDYVAPEPIVRRPGLCGALEYRFQKRFQNGRLIGFPPCVRHPQRLVDSLNRLQHRCRCLYLCALVLLLFAEFFCFFFLFVPIAIFILLIVFGK